MKNIQTSLGVQQTYSCTLCSHVNNIGDNQLNTDKKHETVSVQGTLEMILESSEPEDDNSIAPENNTVQQNQQENQLA